MKHKKILMMLGALVLGCSLPSFAQEELPEVTVKAVRYKYLRAAGHDDAALPVQMLQQRVAAYEVKSADFYEDEYDAYFVTFYLPEGQILAAYDQDGKLLRTAEKYKDIALPKAVREAANYRFPQWTIGKDVYLVNYYEENNTATKVYKLTLQNGNNRFKIKMNEKGERIR
jgi:hypothetical protein